MAVKFNYDLKLILKMEAAMGSSIKIAKYVDKKELANFLRELADAVENGGKDELACVDDFKKMKIAVKDEYGRISIKAKIKSAAECSEEAESVEMVCDAEGTCAPSGKPKYKHLKKRMKSSFRMLVNMIHDDQKPPDEAVQSFLEDSVLMVSYPGYGDEYYESYTAACEAFKAAYQAGDMTKMHETIDVLVHEKSRCHAKYD